MSEIPDKCLIRWGELVEWCAGEGVSVRQVKRLLKEGKISKLRPAGTVRAFYSVRQVYQVIHKKDLQAPVTCRNQRI